MEIGIRTARQSDIDRLQTISDRAWHTAHAPIIGSDSVETFLNEHYDTESFRSRIDDDATILDVAEEPGGSTVGFVMASPDEENTTTFNLSRIYVLPDYWGEGIGQQLLSYLEEAIHQRGGTRIKLGVMAENERALHFYEAAGYKRKREVYDETIDTTSFIYTKNVEK